MAAQLDLSGFVRSVGRPRRSRADPVDPGRVSRPRTGSGAWWAVRMYLTLGLLGLLGLAGYLVSVRRHPYRRCRRCKGVGKHFGTVFSFAHRPCRGCGGFGRKPRLGAR